MAKFYVVQGSIGLPKKDPGNGLAREFWPSASAGIGEAVELDAQQAKGLLETGFIVDEKTWAGLKKMLEGALQAGATLDKKHAKLAAALASHAKK